MYAIPTATKTPAQIDQIKAVRHAIKSDYGVVSIEVKINTLSDLHYTLPGISSKKGKANYTPLPRTSDGALFIRAGAIKAQLRNTAASALKAILFPAGTKTDIYTHVYMEKGGIAFLGDDSKSVAVSETIRAGLLDFHSRLFGSVAIKGDVMLVTDAVADPSVQPHVRESGVRRDVNIDSLAEKYDVSADSIKLYKDKQNGVGKDSDNMSTQTLTPIIEVIPKKTELTGKIVLKNPTKVELGLLLMALDEWAAQIMSGEELRMGGFAGVGMGSVSIDFTFVGSKPDAVDRRKIVKEQFLRVSLTPQSVTPDGGSIMTFLSPEGEEIEEPAVFNDLTTVTKDYIAANHAEIVNAITTTAKIDFDSAKKNGKK